MDVLVVRKLLIIMCKSLGQRISDCDRESNIACILRTIYLLIIIITSIIIVAGVIHQW